MGTLIVGSDLEGAASAGGGLLEDEGDVLAGELRLLDAGVLGPFEVSSQVEQVVHLACRVIVEGQQIPVPEVERHRSLLVFLMSLAPVPVNDFVCDDVAILMAGEWFLWRNT